ncbi:DUF6861 domain-containing protein [Pseudomonas syringae]|uniref:DUF6861 domain-containing protein n=1 Tax=Pseudomonas syringae TaxID=317 RepID=UPI001F0877B7|nr:hypothetical protein [Pseudomonas syringae]
MFFFRMLPSWSELRQRLDHDMGYQPGGHCRNHLNEPAPSRSLIIRRFDCVRRAFVLAEWEAGRVLVRRFSDLDISIIIKDLIDVVAQMAMIVVGSAFTGGLIGAGVGSAFFGIGAYPGGALGTALGLQASTFILGVLGLKSIAEYVVDGFPRIIGYYLSGIKTAWRGPRERGHNPFMSDDPYAQNSATQDIAKGHVEVVMLLLGAVVEYLTRGRGNAGLLAQEMRASPKGERLAQWMLEHEDALKKRPDLQKPEPRRGPFDIPESSLQQVADRPGANANAMNQAEPEVLAKVNSGRSPYSELNGAIGEARGWAQVIESGQIPISAPGKASLPGADYITYDPASRSVIVWDAKYRAPGGSYPASLPPSKLQAWQAEIISSVRNMPEGQAKVAAEKALKAGRVEGRLLKWPQ